MMHDHDIIRTSIYKKKGLIKKEFIKLEDLRESEWSKEFEEYRRNRLLVGAFRYGKIVDNKKSKHLDRIAYIKTKLKRYDETHNLECMVDIANLAMLEFIDMYDVYEFQSMDDAKEHQGVKK